MCKCHHRQWVWIVALVLAISACTYQRKMKLPAVGLPEEVFTAKPLEKNHATLRLGVLSFHAPATAGEAGRDAAEALCQELIRHGVFGEVIFDLSHISGDMDTLAALSRKKGYDLIITGSLAGLLEGSHFQRARVVEEIMLLRADSGQLEPLIHARATETIDPVPPKDYIVAQGKGASAPPTTVLLQRNAQKFRNLLQATLSITDFN